MFSARSEFKNAVRLDVDVFDGVALLEGQGQEGSERIQLRRWGVGLMEICAFLLQKSLSDKTGLVLLDVAVGHCPA